MRQDWVVVGIAGATCSGKSTLAAAIAELLPCATLLQQDDFFHDEDDPRHVIVPELDHINFELLSSLDNDAFLRQVVDVLESSTVARAPPPSPLLPYLPPSVSHVPPVLLLDGFLLLNDPRLASLCDVKLFLTLDEPTCWQRRQARVYGPPDVPGYFQQVVWPFYLRHLGQVASTVHGVHYLDGALPQEETLRNALTIIFSTNQASHVKQ